MFVSMDTLAHMLKDYIAYQHLREDTKLEIQFFQILDDYNVSCMGSPPP